MNDAKYATLDDLEAIGLAAADVDERCPWAVEYTALDGKPFWLRADLEDLLSDSERGDSP